MQAATVNGRIVRPLLGPFAVHDVFPFNAEPVIVYDLTLWKHNHYVSLESLAEIRAGEDSDAETDVVTETLHWRALCHINIMQRGGADLLPPLSQNGTELVKAFAISQGTELEANLDIVVQGISGQYRWGGSRSDIQIAYDTFTFTDPIFTRLQCYSTFSRHLLTPSRWKPSKV
jgi:hypothetical protein